MPEISRVMGDAGQILGVGLSGVSGVHDMDWIGMR
jgi:hypothetical protein